MYSYYYLASLGPNWQKRLSPWKPLITIIQMVRNVKQNTQKLFIYTDNKIAYFLVIKNMTLLVSGPVYTNNFWKFIGCTNGMQGS